MPNIPRVGVSANSLNMQEYTYRNTMVLRTDDSPSLQHWLCSAGMAAAAAAAAAVQSRCKLQQF